MLYLRIFSDDPGHIGLPLQGDNQAFLGSYPQLIRFIIHTSIDRFVLGCLFLLIGFMSIDLFFHRWQQRAYVYIAFGAFTFCTGLFYVSTAEMTQFLFPAPHIRFIAGSIGMGIFPVGLFAFYELILESPYRLLIRRIWQVMLVCGLLLVGLQLSGILFFNIPVCTYLGRPAGRQSDHRLRGRGALHHPGQRQRHDLQFRFFGDPASDGARPALRHRRDPLLALALPLGRVRIRAFPDPYHRTEERRR